MANPNLISPPPIDNDPEPKDDKAKEKMRQFLSKNSWASMKTWFYLLWKVLQNIAGDGNKGVGSINGLPVGVAMPAIGTFSFLGNSIPYLFARNQTAQSIPSTTETILTNWTSPIFYPAGTFNASTGVYTVALPGVYMVSISVSYPAQPWGGTALSSIVYINGVNASDCFNRLVYGTTSQNVQTPPAIWVGFLNAGNTIAAATFQNSGSAQATEGQHSSFTIVKVG